LLDLYDEAGGEEPVHFFGDCAPTLFAHGSHRLPNGASGGINM
jgi:hypothetical protein